MGWLSSIIGAGASLFGANKDAANQKKFAKKGLRWRVEDGLAAGVHPLAAIGFNGPSYSPTYSQIGSAFEGVGQNLDRAMSAQMDAPSRAMTGRANELALENQNLQNKLLEAQIADIHRSWLRPQAGSPPPAPGGTNPLIAGQPDTAVITQPTQYETFEKLFGEPADLYGAMEMARQGSTDENWPVIKKYAHGVDRQILKRVLDEVLRMPEITYRKARGWKFNKRAGMGRYGAASPQ